MSYLYHRKSTPLDEESNCNFTYDCLNEIDCQNKIIEIKTPINKYQEVIDKLSFQEEVDIEFITALQTLVDECDNSKERTGDEEFIERRGEQTRSEILTEYERLKYLSEGLNGDYNNLLKYFNLLFAFSGKIKTELTDPLLLK